MPLYREWSPDAHSLAAVWRIEEPEVFFQMRTGLQSDIRHGQRRMEHLAGRFLLQHLREDFPLLTIQKDAHDKPRIPGDALRFSISHSFPYVAAVVSDRQECGIDLQTWHPRILDLKEKFLTAAEQQLVGQEPAALTLAWSVKEAAYKWQGRRGVEFREHLIITDFTLQPAAHWQALLELRLQVPVRPLTVAGWIEPDFALALAVDGLL